MPSSGVFPVSGSSDIGAAIYGVELIGDASGSGDFRAESDRFFFADRVILQAGDEPSHAVAEIPLTQFEETAPAIAGIRGGPLDGVKVGTRALVFVYSPDSNLSAPLLAGSVVNIQQDLASDGASLTIMDDRWLLRGVHIAGQFIFQPDDGSIVYRQRGPARFNPHGRANCMDSPGGPLFAPFADYGREDGDADPSPGSATSAARPWRLNDIAAYLRRTLCSDELLAQTAAFPWFARVDSARVFVPPSFGAQLSSDGAFDPDDQRAAAGFKANDHARGDAAKAPDLTLEGMDLLSGLTRVLQCAGSFALFCGAAEELTFGGGRRARSVLDIVSTRFIDGISRPLNVLRPAGGTISDTAGRIGVIAGQIEEDGADTYTSVVVSGAPVQLETRVEYTSTGGGALEPAWSSAEETSFRGYVKNHPDRADTPEAFIEACWKFPRVFAAYSVSLNYDALTGTKYAGFPRVTSSPPLLPQLLSTYTEQLSGRKRRVFPYPVTVELKDEVGDYRARSSLDGLEVDDDGTLWLTAHREAGLNDPESGTWKGSAADGDSLLPRDLRMTLAFLLDHRLNASAALGSASLGGGTPIGDPNAEAAAIAGGWSRQYLADCGGAYVEQLRKGAWPLPESLNGSTTASDRATSGSELKTDAALAQSHAQRRLADVGRVKKSSRLVFASCMLFKPGQAIAMLDNRGISSGNYPLRGVVSRVIHDYESNTTAVELE